MLESIRNIVLLLSLLILSFGFGNIFAFNMASESIDQQQKQFMRLYDTYHNNDIMLKCLTVKFIIVNDKVIACSILDPDAKKTPSKTPTEMPEYQA